MIIKNVEIARFGQWRNRSFTLERRLNVIAGDNETGKSTLHAFILYMLFGIHPRGKDYERFDLGQLQNRVGGVMEAEGEDGLSWRLERYGAGAGASVLISGPHGHWPEEEWRKRELGGMSRELYNQLFAFGLDELQEISSLQSEELNRYLFGAGAGIRPGAIVTAERTLTNEMDKLYKPRGRTQALHAALQKVKEAEERLLSVREDAEKFNLLQEQLARLELDMESAEKALDAKERRLAWLNRCLAASGHWKKRVSLQTRLLPLENVPSLSVFDEPRYQYLKERLEDYREQYAEIEQRIVQNRAQIEQLGTMAGEAVRLGDRDWLARKARLGVLMERLGVFREQTARIRELTAERRHAENELERIVRQIHPQWTLEQLREFPASAAEREWVRRHGERMSQLSGQLEQWEREWQRQTYYENTAQDEHAARPLRQPSGRWHQSVLALGGILQLTAAGAAIWSDRLWEGWTAFIVLGIWNVFWWRLTSSRMEAAQDKPFPQDGQRNEAGRQSEVLEQQCRQAKAELEDLTAEWRRWLRKASLPEDVTPAQAAQMFLLFDQAMQAAAALERIRSQLQLLREETEAFIAEAESWLGHPLDADQAEAVLRAEQARFERQQEQRQALARLEEERRRHEADLSAVRAKMQQADTELAAIYLEAGAADERGYLEKLNRAKQREQVLSEFKETEMMLQGVCGEAAVQAVCDELAARGEADIAEERDAIAREIEALRADLNRQRELKGQWSGERQRLSSDEEQAVWRQQLQEHVEEARAIAAEWAKRSLAFHLIRFTREKIESERQPEIIERASHYFQLMTGGRYQGVEANFHERTMLAIRQGGEPVWPARLSRGTREQLYLAIRFSLAEQQAKRKPVPLLFDDIFVNFDEKRLLFALQAVKQLSAFNQIIMFTCHEHVRRAAERVFGVESHILRESGEGA